MTDPTLPDAAASLGDGVGSVLLLGIAGSVGVGLGDGSTSGTDVGISVGASLVESALLGEGGAAVSVGDPSPVSIEAADLGGAAVSAGLGVDPGSASTGAWSVGHGVAEGCGAWPDSARISASERTLPQTLTSSMAPTNPFLRLEQRPKSNSSLAAERWSSVSARPGSSLAVPPA